MIDRLWMTGALLACLFGAGIIFTLFSAYIRFHSRLYLMCLITDLGANFLLVGAILRVVPSVRFLDEGNIYGYMVLSVLGIGILVFGILSLSVELTAGDNSVYFMPNILAVSLIAIGVMSAGMYLQFPAIIGVSELIGVISAFYAAVFALIHISNIVSRRIRRISRLIGISTIIATPMLVLRIVLWNRSIDPLGQSLPPYLLAIFLLLVNGTALIVGSRNIIRQTRKIAVELNAEAISAFEITPRECDIILFIHRGLSNGEIGSRLFISPSTVKNHIYHIYRKTGAHSRIDLLNSVLNQ